MKKSKWTGEQIADQTGRVAIVTGANSGIGLETARELAKKGATVMLGCRDSDRGQAAVEAIEMDELSGSVQLMILDLASLKSVRAFVDDFIGKHSRLDILVNNAGVMMPPYSKTEDGFELQFGVNHLGHFALTGLLLPRLKKTAGSRVVNVSSAAHNWGKMEFSDLHFEERPYRKMASYGQSKLANLLFTFEFQRQLESAGVDTISVAAHPGWTGTNLQRNTLLFRVLNPIFSMKPWQGALPTLFAATAEQVTGGDYFGPWGFQEMRGYPKRVDSSDASKNADDARKLWEVSQKLTGVTFVL